MDNLKRYLSVIMHYNLQQYIIFSIKLSNAIVKLTQECGSLEKHSI